MLKLVNRSARAAFCTITLGALSLGAASCGSASSSSPSKTAVAANQSYTSVPSLVSAAKKEGTLDLYVAPEYVPFLVKGFEKTYPWAKVVSTPVEPPQAAAKFLAEFNAGVKQADVVGLKEPELEPFVKLGAVAKIKVPNDSLISPTLTDSDGYSHPMTATEVALVYNKKLISAGPKDLSQLSTPAWKSKLVIDDPLAGSTGGQLLASQRKSMGDAKWQAWLAGIARNNPEITDSGSSSFEDVLRGDRAMCVCDAHDYSDAAKGSPLGIDFYNQDSSGIIVTPTIAIVSSTAPHPAMAALFLNWMESPSGGQMGFVQSGRSPVVTVPGVKPVVPASVKRAPLFNVLGDYYHNPDSYNAAFKKYFGNS